MYLLDTNVVSELHRAIRGKGDPSATAWLAQVNLSDCFLAAVTLMELEVGVLRMERRDAAQSAMLRVWLDQRVIPEFSNRILPVDAAVARRCAGLHVPNPRPERDAYIAATAHVHGLVVATRNTADFEPMGSTLLNPWKPWQVQEQTRPYRVGR